MALVHRKRINSTLSAEIFDLAIDVLKDKLESKDILTLISEYKKDAK